MMAPSARSESKSKNPNPARALIATENSELSPFRRRVFLALCEVPEGKVATYKALATKLGCKSSQAVGQALKHNPYAPIVPCHRVIKSDRSLGGFGGARAGEKIEKKRRLLEAEGVQFDGREVRDDCIFTFKEV